MYQETYHKKYRQQDVMSASPLRLVIMTYDLAIRPANNRISPKPPRPLAPCAMLWIWITRRSPSACSASINGAWTASVKAIMPQPSRR